MCFPFDPMKTIIQNEDRLISQYEAFQTIIKNNGYNGLYKGLIPLTIRAFYINGIIFLINDRTRCFMISILNI